MQQPFFHPLFFSGFSQGKTLDLLENICTTLLIKEVMHVLIRRYYCRAFDTSPDLLPLKFSFNTSAWASPFSLINSMFPALFSKKSVESFK